MIGVSHERGSGEQKQPPALPRPPVVPKHSKRVEYVDVFNSNVCRVLPLLPRTLLKEASQHVPLKDRQQEIERVTEWVRIHYRAFFREEVWV